MDSQHVDITLEEIRACSQNQLLIPNELLQNKTKIPSVVNQLKQHKISMSWLYQDNDDKIPFPNPDFFQLSIEEILSFITQYTFSYDTSLDPSAQCFHHQKQQFTTTFLTQQKLDTFTSLRGASLQEQIISIQPFYPLKQEEHYKSHTKIIDNTLVQFNQIDIPDILNRTQFYPFKFENQEIVAFTCPLCSINYENQDSFLKHLACEKLRLLGLLWPKEQYEMRWRAAINEANLRVVQHQVGDK